MQSFVRFMLFLLRVALQLISQLLLTDGAIHWRGFMIVKRSTSLLKILGACAYMQHLQREEK